MKAKSGALIAQFQKISKEKYPSYKPLFPVINSIYEKRKRADHFEKIYDKSAAERVLKEAEDILKKLWRVFE